MDSELHDLLRNVASKTQVESKSHTHITHYPRTRWVLSDENLEMFWRGYCELAYRKLKGSDEEEAEPLADICLAETPKKHMPVVGKFLFKFEVSDEDEEIELYDDVFLQRLVNIYQKVLRELFDCSTKADEESCPLELAVVVMESSVHWFEEYEDKNIMMKEVQLHFPYAKVEASLQNQLLRPYIIQLLKNNNVMSRMNMKPIGEWETILDGNVVDKPLTMYGSTDKKGKPKLEVKYIWSDIRDEMLEEGIEPVEVGLEDIFVPMNHGDITDGAVSPSIFGDDVNHELWLPMFLSINYYDEVLLPLRNDMSRPSMFEMKRPIGSQRMVDDENIMSLCEQLLTMINNSRFQQETLWLDVGKAFYNADEGGENGLRAWISHSERAVGRNIPEFMMRDEGSLSTTSRNLYNTFSKAAITAKTLGFYAREDSPFEYGRWHKEWCLRSLESALGADNTDVAIALYRVYWLDYIYCPIGKGKWFKFKNNRWSEMHHGIELRRAISSDFVKRFEVVRHLISEQIMESDDETFKTLSESKMKQVTVLIKKLKSVNYKNQIMTEATEHFVQDNFMDLLDLDSDLTGVLNGVLEIVGNTVQFRKAKPEDYISMSTGVPFHEYYSWKHDMVKRTLKWLSQVFTDKSLLHHFLKFAASCLKGRNADKIFPIWTGSGNNSKSMIVKLFESVLGAYCIKFPVAMLTDRNTSAGSAAPQLARAKHTRIAFLDEPEDDIPMNKGTIKRYTGGDAFYARSLHENGGDIEATFKMVLMCNKPPIIPNADKAVKNRTRLFPFTSTWVKDPPETEEEQMKERKFKMDPNFEKQIPHLAPAFLWIMVHYYPQYATEGLEDPEIVTQWTDTYWRDNDIYAQFAAETITEVWKPDGTKDENVRVTLSEIYSQFKSWYKEAVPGEKVPQRQAVRSELVSRWGPLHGNSWHGIRLTGGEGVDNLAAALGSSINVPTSLKGYSIATAPSCQTQSEKEHQGQSGPSAPIMPTKPDKLSDDLNNDLFNPVKPSKSLDDLKDEVLGIVKRVSSPPIEDGAILI